MAQRDDKDTALHLVIAQLDRMEGKLDKLDDRLDASEKVQIRHEASLAEHMRRTDLLEQRQDELTGALRPIIDFHKVALGICKIIGGVGVIAGIVAAVVKVLEFL